MSLLERGRFILAKLKASNYYFVEHTKQYHCEGQLWNEKTYQCPLCLRTMKNCHRDKHIALHESGNGTNCPECNWHVSKTELAKHKMTYHCYQTTYQCTLCPKTMKNCHRDENIALHERGNGTICPECNCYVSINFI